MGGEGGAGLGFADLDRLGALVAEQFLTEHGYGLLERLEPDGCAARLVLGRGGAAILADVVVTVGDGRSRPRATLSPGRKRSGRAAALRWLMGHGEARALAYDVVEVVFTSAAEVSINHYAEVGLWVG